MLNTLFHISSNFFLEFSVMEFKTIDSGLQVVGVVGSGGSLSLLNGVAQGTDYTDRLGRVINIESLTLRVFGFINNATSASTGDYLRVMVIVDEQANGAAPSLADILQASDFTQPNNLNFRDRFTTLYNQFHIIPSYTMTAGELSTGSPKPTMDDLYIDLDINTVFSGTGATIASISTNSVYLLLLTLNSSINCVYNSRIRFTDK